MLQLSRQGFQCAQILLILALESEGKENADLVRAVGGLNMGLSDKSGPCGCLTGCCCLISYFAGKGADEELEDPACSDMLTEFTSWFKEEYDELYGGHTCNGILDGDAKNMLTRCPDIVRASYLKAMEILQTNGVI